jgi:hypothetical protein
MIDFIEGTKIAERCDYSFGDQASVSCGIPGGFMKPASLNNQEFIEKINSIVKERNYMTLFIDNIRLYKRPIQTSNPSDQIWVESLFKDNDLLDLCSKFPEMNFIIFTNLEDTPIDSEIENKIPKNVIKIYSANAIYFNDEIRPFPYGLQRRMHSGDDRTEVIQEILSSEVPARNLLYVNHNINTNPNERQGISDFFQNQKWALTDNSRITYREFLSRIRDHKFMICPIGNAIDCHRNWEVLYCRRVPIMKRNTYLEELFKGFPVLFVEKYSDITEDLLINKNYLYEESISMDLNNLDLGIIFNKIIKENI